MKPISQIFFSSYLTSTELSTLNAFSYLSGMLSFFGTLFILSCYFTLPKQRNRPFQTLIFFFSATDCLSSLTTLLTLTCASLSSLGSPFPFVNSTFQVPLATLKLFLYTASVLWTAIIATEMLWRVKCGLRVTCLGEVKIDFSLSRPIGLTILYHVLGWGVPLFFVLLSFQPNSNLFELIFIVLLITNFFYLMFIYFAIPYFLNKQIEHTGIYTSQENKFLTQLNKRFEFYLLIYFIEMGNLLPISALFSWLDFFVVIGFEEKRTIWLVIGSVYSFCFPLVGFLNSCVYGWNSFLWEELRGKMSCYYNNYKKKVNKEQAEKSQPVVAAKLKGDKVDVK